MTGTRDSRLLLIFLRRPEPGRVKTRLAKSVGDDHALSIYRKLLNHTHNVALGVRSDRQAWFAPQNRSDNQPASLITETDNSWGPPQFARHLQPEGNLGEKMKHAFEQGFDSGYRKIVIIGSDCPVIRPSHIETAYRELDNTDVVLGPSRDGGYYLLGLNRLHTDLFERMPWSRESLYERTLNVIEKLSLGLYELETLNDIDTAEDLNRLRKSGVDWL